MVSNLSKATMTQALLAALKERGWRLMDIGFVSACQRDDYPGLGQRVSAPERGYRIAAAGVG